MVKIKKTFKYLKFRGYELLVSLKEFKKGSKLTKRTYKTFQDSSLLISAHSVEKGLGLRNAGPGHSGKVVDQLLNKLIGVAKDSDQIQAFPFQETLRIVIAYMDFQEKFDVSQFSMYKQLRCKYDKLLNVLGDSYVSSLRKCLEAGYEKFSKEQLLEGKEFDFPRFISSRHSIRSFKKAQVANSEIQKAIAIANRSPSACNRQPSYVYFCSSAEKVAVIDRLITGSSGFKGEVPNYIVVTTDRACFSYVEQYQWYINGGIYLAYLSLAFHSLGIGHCIMQWKAFCKTEKEIKKLLGISETEAIIAVVGCGYYADEVACLKAQRKETWETLRIVE